MQYLTKAVRVQIVICLPFELDKTRDTAISVQDIHIKDVLFVYELILTLD